jgi:hypothetical protein
MLRLVQQGDSVLWKQNNNQWDTCLYYKTELYVLKEESDCGSMYLSWKLYRKYK